MSENEDSAAAPQEWEPVDAGVNVCQRAAELRQRAFDEMAQTLDVPKLRALSERVRIINEAERTLIAAAFEANETLPAPQAPKP